MHLVPAPAITDLCGEDDKKLFGLLPSPRSSTNHFQKSHQFLSLKKAAETFKKIFADIYFCPNYDCFEEKEATVQILLETSAGTHKPMQNWDKLKKAIASRKERQTSQPNATLIPTRDRPLGQLQSHLAQAWSWARRRHWHQKSSPSKSRLQFGDLLRGTDSDRLVTPSTANTQLPTSKTLQVRQFQGHCDPWAPCKAKRALCACIGKQSNSTSVNDKNTLAVLSAAWQGNLYQLSAVQGLKSNLPSETPATSRNCVLEWNWCLCSAQPAPGPRHVPSEHCTCFVPQRRWISQES